MPGELLEGSSKRGSAKTGVEKRRVVEPEEFSNGSYDDVLLEVDGSMVNGSMS